MYGHIVYQEETVHKFELFKTQIDMPKDVLDHISFSHAIIEEKTASWTLVIQVLKQIDIHHLKTLTDYVKTYFKPSVVKRVDVKYVHDLHWDIETLQKYADTIIHDYTKLKPSAGALKHFDFVIDQRSLTFVIDTSSTYIKDHFKRLTEAFQMYGFNITCQYEISDEIPDETLIVEHEKRELDVMHQQKVKHHQKEIQKEAQSFKVKRSAKAMKISDIPKDQYQLDQYTNTQGETNCLIEGEVIEKDIRELKNNSKLLTMTIADEEDAIIVKSFLNHDKEVMFAASIDAGHHVQITGFFKYDTFQRDVVVMIKKIQFLDILKTSRRDRSKQKRIEFHVHSTMSNLDGISSISDYVQTIASWGHEAIAITDHDGVYGFPELANAARKAGIKPIYGVELNTVNLNSFYVIKGVEKDLDMRQLTYVVFDIETTGFSVTHDRMIEIAAVKLEKGVIIDTYQQFIDPEVEISAFTTELTSITNDMVIGQPLVDDVMRDFMAFTEGAVLVAHNASFDTDFVEYTINKYDIIKTYQGVIDTLQLSRLIYEQEMKTFNLKALAKHFKIKQEAHHRAEDDAKVTADIWLLMMQDLSSKGLKTSTDYYMLHEDVNTYKHMIPYHLNILVREQKGLKNLYHIVSDSLTTHFYKGARAIKQVIDQHRDGLLIGSGCYKGEVFETALNKSDDALREVITYYDYVEVQPLDAYQHLYDQVSQDVILQTMNKIIDFCEKLNVLVIASSDAHYIEKSDQLYRDIYIRTPQVGGGIHDLKRYQTMPHHYLRTTDEMLEAFSFLGVDAEKIVINNTHYLNKRIDHIQLFPDGLLTIQDDAFSESLNVLSIEAEVRRIVSEKLNTLYGEKPHPFVLKRVERELKNIIENRFAAIYYMSYLLVQKSLNEGYLVGSRGSVGSSLVATLMDITEVNPLKPHYRCQHGHFTAFEVNEDLYNEHGYQEDEERFQVYFQNVYCGFDLPTAMCPKCGEPLIKDGHDIPFETFLGFKGDKIPDIDLNFSGEYQAKAHDYVKTLVGETQAFRAGTIQTIAEKNAYGYVKGYLEDHHIEMRQAQITRMAKRIEGVKRSTGQHPGGIIVVPDGYHIHDITPIQYPANNTDAEWLTTHYDYHAFEDNLLKLDILGHDDPTMIKFLMDYVNKHPESFPFKDAKDIPLDDQDVLKMFSQTDIIGINHMELMSDIASFAIPEFNTNFTRQMLSDIKPNTFAGLVKVSGLSHGTDVWLKNAQDLIKGATSHGRVPIDDIIGCRDDIMVQLIDFGLEPLRAFEIMEFVRRGKPSKEPNKWLEYEAEMRLTGVPEWYIWSCQKIKYMFPKAHATAYVMMAIRIAWFKIHHPLLFYSAYFSKRADKFDYERMLAGPQAIKNGIKGYQEMSKLSAKDESILTTLLVAYEMVLRGYSFKKVDIMKSDASVFVMEDNALRMPFRSIDGLGDSVANDIIEKRIEKTFTSKEDVMQRTKINQSIFQLLDTFGAFDDIIVANDGNEKGLFAL